MHFQLERYASCETRVRAELHAMAGNLINVEAGLSPFPGGPQGHDRSNGALFLVEHHF